jgi:hypothetical protein
MSNGLYLKTISFDWGYELHISDFAKIIFFYKNKKMIHETISYDVVIYVQSGKVLLFIKNEYEELLPGMAYRIEKNTYWDIIGMEASEIFYIKETNEKKRNIYV